MKDEIDEVLKISNDIQDWIDDVEKGLTQANLASYNTNRIKRK